MGYPDYLVHFNKNHDKKTGRFTFGDGNGDGISPDDYKTPELDKKYSELEKSGVFKFNTIKPVGNTGDAEKEWGKEIVNATDVGIKALNKTRYKGEFNDYDFLDDVNKNGERHWFLFDDQTYGMPELAYLVNKGWSKDKIIDAFKTSSDLRDVNSKYEDDYLANKNVTFNDKNWYETYKEADKSSPYKGIWNIAEGYDRMDYSGELDKYIDACIEVSKETKHSDEYSEYLMHYNKNHDPKSGRFTFSPDTPKIRPFAKEEGKLNSPTEKWKYKKQRRGELRGQGYTKIGARAFAQTEANIKLGLARQRNQFVKENIKYTKKANKYREAGNTEKAKMWTDKAILSYKNAKLTDTYMNDKSIQDLGKVMVTTLSTEFVKGMIFENNRPTVTIYI